MKEKKEWRGGRHKGGELRAVESGTLSLFTLLRPCTAATATPTPPPMLSNWTTSAPFWSSWNADFHPPTPPYISHPSFSCKTGSK